MRARGLLVSAALAAGVCLAPFAAQAAVVVVGGSLAQQCSDAAVHNRALEADVAACTTAIETELLDPENLAGTYVNRGVLLGRMGRTDAAIRDFDFAINASFHLGEAYVNRGAMLMNQGQYNEGLVDTDRALTAGLREPEKAWFNRGIAHEYLGDVRTAYSDYRRAAELRPSWERPRMELARFTVR